MIRGVNFLETEAFDLTYRRMAIGLALVLGLCLFLYVIQSGRQIYLTKKMASVQTEIIALKARQEQTASHYPQLKGGALTVQQALRPLFEKAVDWGGVLKDFSRRLPPQVWLKGFKTYELVGGAPTSPGHTPYINFNGFSHDMGSISLFINFLEKSPYFNSVILTNTSREMKGKTSMYKFSIDAEVKKGVYGKD